MGPWSLTSGSIWGIQPIKQLFLAKAKLRQAKSGLSLRSFPTKDRRKIPNWVISSRTLWCVALDTKMCIKDQTET